MCVYTQINKRNGRQNDKLFDVVAWSNSLMSVVNPVQFMLHKRTTILTKHILINTNKTIYNDIVPNGIKLERIALVHNGFFDIVYDIDKCLPIVPNTASTVNYDKLSAFNEG